MQISQKTSLSILAVIITVAAILRLFHLGLVPEGMTWDEAAIGYNGYAIVTTRRDEWLTKLPTSFKSFGDYKAPLAIYITGLFTTLLGSNPLVLRLPFALAGIAAVAGIYLLLQQLLARQPNKHLLAIIGSGLLALSPWHIFFSRVGFEAGMALTLCMFMVVCFLQGIQNTKKQIWFTCAAILATLSLYAYHSAKVFTPLFTGSLALLYRRELYNNLRSLVSALIIGLLGSVPLLYDSVWGNGLERAGVTVFSKGNSLTESMLTSLQQFAQHFSPQFLFFGETTTLRHGTGHWGVFFPTTGLLFLVFVIYLLNQLRQRVAVSRVEKLLLLWVCLGILPAAIATESPHPNRSLLALPGFIGLAVLGFDQLRIWLEKQDLDTKWLDSKKMSGLLLPSVLGTLLNIHILLFLAFSHYYFTQFNSISAPAFQTGYQEAVAIARQYEKGLGNKPRVDQIVFSRGYGQPYIYILYLNRINPIAYHGGILVNYLFVDSIGIGDMQRSNTLLVATADSELPEEKATHLVYAADGTVRFKLYYLPPKQ